MQVTRATCVMLAAASAALAAAPAAHDLMARHVAGDPYSFPEYLSDFGLRYPDAHEYALRADIFARRYADIMAHNSAGVHAYAKGINHMTAWTDAEHAALMGYKAQPRAKTGGAPDVTEFVGHAADPTEVLPASVDWRACSPYASSELCPLDAPQVQITTAIKNQGHCGSCYSFASTATLESHAAIYENVHYELAPQHVVSCAPNANQCGGTGGCEGSTADVVYEWIHTNGGLASAFTYGYESGLDGITRSCDYNRTTPFVTVGAALGKPTSNNYAAIKSALVHKGPLAVNVAASNWHNYESGVWTDCGYDDEDGLTINHVVVLEGYGVDDKTGLAYWLIRNSWGPMYGENGYIRLHMEAEETCGYDTKPADGWDCAPFPDRVRVCGCNGVAYEPTFPTSVTVVGSK